MDSTSIDCPYSIKFYETDTHKHIFSRIGFSKGHTIQQILTMAFQVYGLYIQLDTNKHTIYIHIPDYIGKKYPLYYTDRLINEDVIRINYEVKNNRQISINNNCFNVIDLISYPFDIIGRKYTNDIMLNLDIHIHRYLFCCFALNEILNKDYIIEDIQGIMMNRLTRAFYPAYFY
jgi:hypothetical protein